MSLHTETKVLRELVREQRDQLAAIHRIAAKARLALADHDLELLGMLLTQIQTGDEQPPTPHTPQHR